jgi:hypothetical protein
MSPQFQARFSQTREGQAYRFGLFFFGQETGVSSSLQHILVNRSEE